MFDYFYGQSGEMFSYFRVPKILFRDIRFKDLSTDVKTLYYLTVQAEGGAWEYALYQGDCCLLERGEIDAPELMIEEVRDEILYSHNLRNKDCIPLTQEELIHELRLMQCYLMPDETALRELSESVIEKLKLLTDVEFAELEFHPD